MLGVDMPILFPDLKRMMLGYKNPDRENTYRERITILSVDTSVAVGVKTLQFQAVVKPNSKLVKGNYTTTIRFFDVKGSEVQTNTNHDSIEQDGKTYYYQTPSVKKNPVQIKCSCSSYRFEFEYQNYQVGALIGNWRRYKRKTPPAQRPANPKNPNPIGADFVNPADLQGYCKHLNALIKLLYKQGKVKA